MGFAQGSVSLRRFYMTGKHPHSLTANWLKRLEQHAFSTTDSGSPDGFDVGWIGPDHLYDVDFSVAERFRIGRYAYLAMRIDRTAPPPAIVASYRKEEELAALEASGRPALSKADRQAAREAACAKADAEAKAGLFRRVTAFPVLIDFEDGVVLLGTTGVGAADRLMALFADTFDTSLMPADMDECAHRFSDRSGLTSALETSTPTLLVEDETGDLDDSVWGTNAHPFLAREFLSWIWYQCQSAEGVIDVPHGKHVLVCIQDAVNMKCPVDAKAMTSIRCDAPGKSAEARAALCTGKLPSRMGLQLAAGSSDWRLTLDAARLGVTGLVMVPPESDEDALEYRFDQIRQFLETVDQVIAAFLEKRLGTEWETELDAMRKWARTRSPSAGDALRVATA